MIKLRNSTILNQHDIGKNTMMDYTTIIIEMKFTKNLPSFKSRNVTRIGRNEV
jgi:hypothetical protein